MVRKPDSVIVLNGILPRSKNRKGLLVHRRQNLTKGGNPVDGNNFDFWPVIETVNRGLKEFATGYENIRFYNSTDIFLERRNKAIFINGDLLMSGFLHPSAAGHKIWGDEIVNYIVEEIGV